MEMILSYGQEVFSNVNNLFGGFSSSLKEQKKISFWTNLANRFSVEGIKNSEEIIYKLKFLIDEIKTKEVTEAHLDHLLNEVKKAKRVIVLFVALSETFEIDTSLAAQFLKNTGMIRHQLSEIVSLLKLYASVWTADMEFKKGQTLTHEELFSAN